MHALTTERQRRRKVLKDAGASKLENYKGGDMPMLVVFVSELLLLQSATSKSDLTNWLELELTSARACGMRYIIATQTASNFSTQWRSQINLFLAGYQTSRHGDEPNTGMTTSDIEQLDGVPPSKLPAPHKDKGTVGIFLALQGANALNLRTSPITDQQRDYLLSILPTATPKAIQPAPAAPRPASIDDEIRRMQAAMILAQDALPADQPAPALVAGASALQNGQERLVAPGSGSTSVSVSDTLEPLPVAPELVPADEQRQIIELAKRVSSRRALCKQLYDGQTGGKAYAKVQQVCDAAGLLMPSQAVAA
jgi:hypothetical protein